MPVYDEATQNSFLIALNTLLTNYGVDTTPAQNDLANFKVDFMDLIIKKDRQEARRIGQVLKENLTAAQWNKAKQIILENFTEYSAADIGE